MQRNNTMTRRFLADAGVSAGMRVMEIGCGSGEVTLLLADLVGPSGVVLAIDRDPGAIAMAQDRVREQGIEHVQFVAADVAEPFASLENVAYESFDALAGRRVLMYLPNPSETLRRLAKWLKGGGVVVFEETDSTMVPGSASILPAHDEATELLRKMLVAEGANTAMGFCLPATLTQAGLTFGRVRAEAVIQGQGTQYPLHTLLSLVQSRIVGAELATKEDIDALVLRLQSESRDPTCVYVSEMSFCAWGSKPRNQ